MRAFLYLSGRQGFDGANPPFSPALRDPYSCTAAELAFCALISTIFIFNEAMHLLLRQAFSFLDGSADAHVKAPQRSFEG